MKKIKIDGLEFEVITAQDQKDLDQLDFLLRIFARNNFELLFDTREKSPCRNKSRLQQFLRQLPKEEQLLLQKLKKT